MDTDQQDPAGTRPGQLGLGKVGIALNVTGSYLAEAAEAEQLGYSAIWLPGGQLDQLSRLTDLLGATTAVPVAPAIIPISRRPGAVASACAQSAAMPAA